MSKDKLFSDIVKRVAEESTCCRVQVGALLVKDNRIIATGWNGVPAGKKHCKEIFKTKYKSYVNAVKEGAGAVHPFNEEHYKFSIENELHAEQNLIAFCAKNGIKTDGTTLYVTVSPCIHCAKMILSAGILEVRYLEEYDRENIGISFLIENGISVIYIGG